MHSNSLCALLFQIMFFFDVFIYIVYLQPKGRKRCDGMGWDGMKMGKRKGFSAAQGSAPPTISQSRGQPCIQFRQR